MTPFARLHLVQQGLPQTMNSLSLGPSSNGTSNSDSQKSPEAMGNTRLNRHSMEASLAAYGQSDQHGQVMSNEPVRPTLANIHPSYSTNGVCTLKKANGIVSTITHPKTQAQQQFHNHNASLSAIPSSGTMATDSVHDRDTRWIFTLLRKTFYTTKSLRQTRSQSQSRRRSRTVFSTLPLLPSCSPPLRFQSLYLVQGANRTTWRRSKWETTPPSRVVYHTIESRDSRIEGDVDQAPQHVI